MKDWKDKAIINEVVAEFAELAKFPGPPATKRQRGIIWQAGSASWGRQSTGMSRETSGQICLHTPAGRKSPG